MVGIATTRLAGHGACCHRAVDVMVLDLALDGEDGLTVAREALRVRPDAGIVVATGLDPDAPGRRGGPARRAGLGAQDGHSPRPSSMRSAAWARGETRIPAELLAGALMSLTRDRPELPTEPARGSAELTSRELEVLGCLVEGMSRTEIGDLLHVSPNTVRTHVQSILHKLQVHSALAAVAIARHAGVTGAELSAARPDLRPPGGALAADRRRCTPAGSRRASHSSRPAGVPLTVTPSPGAPRDRRTVDRRG